MTRDAIRREARAFAIWRAARAVHWQCSAAEAAAEVGIPVAEVRAIAKARGWRFEPEDAGQGDIDRQPLTALMGRVSRNEVRMPGGYG